ncbi:homeobox protein PKNOX2-like isoform X2 [Limulus polyphemus]|uniref:Homeobox protein PKNOX2-like isoform X2 n=1 Tax=Limulus polyphemus TaxID=6850 RepID=A0ABM1SED7_LIMPO|nr:homeobox protein PKNOX2-like isoform X2 [Limulus polyphemus]
MQEPSPGTTQGITVVPQSAALPIFPDTPSQMIGQCRDMSEVSGQALVGGNVTSQPAMDPTTQAQFEADKRAVYKHPLFPLLALLFEKCEIAMQSAEAPLSESFTMDIQAFVQHQERDRKPIFIDDPEVDGLMIKAIQVLRIHLLELEKVQDLCKDFCNRYIACLKNKMQSENLLRSEYPALTNGTSSSAESSPGSTPDNSQHQSLTSNGSLGNIVLQQGISQNSVLSPNQIVSGGTVYQMVQTPQGIVAQPIQIGASSSGAPGENRVPPIAPKGLIPHGESDEEDIGGKKKQKRGVLPKHATSIMRSWLFQHIVHPYPTEDEKRQIAAQTNLNLLQVNNWFINARRRILQPMLDASNPDASHKAKKAKTQTSRQAQRFWPENIAALQASISDPDTQQADGSGGQNTNPSSNHSSSQDGIITTKSDDERTQRNHHTPPTSPEGSSGVSHNESDIMSEEEKMITEEKASSDKCKK